MPVPFVGQRFDPAGFSQYLAQVQFGQFKPKFVTLHHTASPSLAQRPNGFSAQHLQNLLDYYQNKLKWNGAPHLFIDDQPNPIIVFQRLDRRGVHAVSFNSNSWGIEMLGDFDVEPFSSGRGALVRDNSMQALALMCGRLGVDASTTRFHRDDPKTSKSCPGRNVTKSDVVSRVAALLQQAPPPDMSSDPTIQWTVMLPGNQPFVPVRTKGGRPIVRVRSFLEALKQQPKLTLTQNQTVVSWKRSATNTVDLPVAELDEEGKAWCLVRLVAEAAGRKVTVGEQIITLG